jgi:hypothetical protein
MTAPVPWSLAWNEDGELASQDRFDLLQTLVVSESEAVQPELVVAVERIGVEQLTKLSTDTLTPGLCA